MKSILTVSVAVALLLGMVMASSAKGEKIQIGSTRQEVIAAYGQPNGTMTSANEEILSYPQGMISLKSGAVVYIDPDWGTRQQPAAEAQKPKPAKSAAERDWFGREKAEKPAEQPAARDSADVKVFANKGQQIDLRTVLEPGKVTVVDFYADWCGPCRRISPELERLAAGDPDVVLRKVDIVNWETPVVKQYNIRSVPNVRVYDRNGTPVGSPTSSLQDVKNNISRAK